MKKLLSLLSLAAVLLSGYSCTNLSLAGGSSSTDNAKVLGVIRKPFGEASPRTVVTLVPVQYDPYKDTLALPIDTTDDSGRYSFSNVAFGSYNVMAINSDDRTRALSTGVRVAADTVTVPFLSLAEPGVIKVMLPAGADLLKGYMYAPGTTIAALLSGAAGFVFLDSVPAGIVPAVYYSTVNGTVSTAIRYAVRLLPGDTVVIFNPEWKYARQLLLNTTTSGAGVSGNVMTFPVLVRLTSSNFNFAEAKANGDDLRFTKPDNTFLPYEIERWNAAQAQAEIWVKADTVYGNDSTHCFVMYWGNASAGAASDGAAVFDTGAGGGFVGVWHLAQAGNTTAFDATANHFDGTPTGMSSASAVAGTIGVAQRFNGSSSGITLPNTAHGKFGFYGNGNYSFSAWVYTDTLDTVFQPIIAKSNYQYALQIRNSRQWEFFIYKDSVWQHTRSSAVAGRWKYIAGVRENDRQYLFIDGSLVNGTISTLIETPRTPDDTTRNVTIGFLPEMSRFHKGMIDEVRAMNSALPADWIKLSYMNQKAIDALVEFR